MGPNLRPWVDRVFFGHRSRTVFRVTRFIIKLAIKAPNISAAKGMSFFLLIWR